MLGIAVVNFDLYRPAFVHKSAASSLGCSSYERLEFLGDSILSFVVAKYLYDKLKGDDEGAMTRMRTKLVSGKTLAFLADRMQLHKYIVMNHRGKSQGWQHNKRIREDCFEAVVGAMYLDLGLCTVRNWFLALVETHIDVDELGAIEDNYKDQLMKLCQAEREPLPTYAVCNDAVRDRYFVVQVRLRGACGTGRGTSKKEAEQWAACNLLQILRGHTYGH